jgi:hypothetical protein
MDYRLKILKMKVDAALKKADSVMAEVKALTVGADKISVRSTGTLDLSASSKLTITSTGTSFELNSTHAQLKHGGQSVECVGGETTIRGASVTWD